MTDAAAWLLESWCCVTLGTSKDQLHEESTDEDRPLEAARICALVFSNVSVSLLVMRTFMYFMRIATCYNGLVDTYRHMQTFPTQPLWALPGTEHAFGSCGGRVRVQQVVDRRAVLVLRHSPASASISQLPKVGLQVS